MLLRAGDVISKTELTERVYDRTTSATARTIITTPARKLDPDEALHRSKRCADGVTARDCPHEISPILY